MELYQFNIPSMDNNGISAEEAHWRFKQAMLDVAGGYTELPLAHGAWRDDNGHVYEEAVIVYQVASDEGAKQHLLHLAFDTFPDQEAIFSARIGEATISDRPEVYYSDIAGAPKAWSD